MSADEKATSSRLFAGQALSIAGSQVSANLDKFSGWLMAGVGSLFALLLTNMDRDNALIAIRPDIHMGARIFVGSCAFAIAARYLAAIVAGMEAARSIGEKLPSAQHQHDPAIIAAEIVRAVLPPMRYIARWRIAKMQSGDDASSGRTLYKIAQIQSLLILAQSVAALWSVLHALSGI